VKGAASAVAICAIGGVAISGQPPAPNAAPTYNVLSPGPPAARTPKDVAEFEQMFKEISNWGRWGKDDQRGSVNLITPAKRKQALALARMGETVSLAHNPEGCINSDLCSNRR
jgi:hypothetical protein